MNVPIADRSRRGEIGQVPKWLGHSTLLLTLTAYADYINEDERAAPKVGRGTFEPSNVVPLERKA